MNNHNKKEILIVEDDIEQATLVAIWLQTLNDVSISIASSGEAALHMLSRKQYNIMLTDVELIGINGIKLTREARTINPEMQVIIFTAHGKLEYAMEAVRNHVTDFLMKPLNRNEIVDKVKEALKEKRTHITPAQTVLAIGAHPDDVEIGCGGTLGRHVAQGDNVTILTLTGGSAGGQKSIRLEEAKNAAMLLGADLELGNLNDTLVTEGPETISIISEVVNRIKPDVVYTHTSNDTHQDHRAVHQASIVACRHVPSLYCYQSPSSTTGFCPNTYVEINGFVKSKLSAIDAYKTQVSKCDYLDPELIRATARYWGRYACNSFVEPLEVIRKTQPLPITINPGDFVHEAG